MVLIGVNINRYVFPIKPLGYGINALDLSSSLCCAPRTNIRLKRLARECRKLALGGFNSCCELAGIRTQCSLKVGRSEA